MYFTGVVKNRTLILAGDAENFPVDSGGGIKIVVRVHRQIPDISLVRIVVEGRFALGVQPIDFSLRRNPDENLPTAIFHQTIEMGSFELIDLRHLAPRQHAV